MGADPQRAEALRVPLVAPLVVPLRPAPPPPPLPPPPPPPPLLLLLLLTASPVAAPLAFANNASLSEAVGGADQTFQWVLAYLLRTQQW